MAANASPRSAAACTVRATAVTSEASELDCVVGGSLQHLSAQQHFGGENEGGGAHIGIW
jgi:hypothetical protein